MTPSHANTRVVVTGVGMISPLGLNVQDSWLAACAGKSGVGPITHFEPKECPVTFAAEVKGFEPTRTFAPLFPRGKNGPPLTTAVLPKETRRYGRFTQLGLAAGVEAYQDSGLDLVRDQISPERIGVQISAGMGGLPEIEAVHDEFRTKGFRRISPFFITQVIPNMISGQLSILLHLQGPNLCTVTACASSAHGIGESARIIQRGDADVMICGGAEAVISELGIGGFAAMKALSTRNEEPTRASRPFDVGRDGFVMGEGAAVLVLENRDHALKRGAKIYAELYGYGLSSDAYHITSPAPGGEGGARAMKQALQEAQRTLAKLGTDFLPSSVGYVNAHGTSTPAGDSEEAQAIAGLFPQAPSHLHVSSTKSMTGHLLGAAGALEAIFSCLAIRDGVIPPTLNLEQLDPECQKSGLNFTALQAVKKPVQFALSNSFGFGGTNASLLFGHSLPGDSQA